MPGAVRENRSRRESTRSRTPPTPVRVIEVLRGILAGPASGPAAGPELRNGFVSGSALQRRAKCSVLESPDFAAMVATEAPEVLPMLAAWRRTRADSQERATRRLARASRAHASQSIDASRARPRGRVHLGPQHYPDDYNAARRDLPASPRTQASAGERGRKAAS